MKALRAKFFCDWFKEPYEVDSFVPQGRYWRLPIRLFERHVRAASGDEALAGSPHDDIQILEFYCQGVNEDMKGQYYHYFSKGL